MYHNMSNSIMRQKGISLLELMVALAIGLILLMALASLMVTAHNSAKQRSTSEQLDEQARQVFSRFESDLYRAGFVDSFTNENTLQEAFDTNNTATVSGYARQIANITNPALVTLLGRNTNGAILPLQGFDQNSTPPSGMTCTESSQCLQIAYQAISNSTTGFSTVATESQEDTSMSGARVGCNGLQAQAAFPILINSYQLQVPGAGETRNSLYCQSNRRDFSNQDGGGNTGTGMQPIVLGVEQLVFRYLVTPENTTAAGSAPDFDTTISGRSVTQYLDVEGVEATPLQWAGVVGVEVCVVVAAEPQDGSREGDIPSVQPTVPSCVRANNNANANVPWAADIPRVTGDMRLHRRYVRTIMLPNSLHLVN